MLLFFYNKLNKIIGKIVFLIFKIFIFMEFMSCWVFEVVFMRLFSFLYLKLILFVK